MIAKLIAHGATRTDALDALAGDCAGVEIWPVKTNAAFLVRALRHPDFRSGNVSTGFIAENETHLIDFSELHDSLKTDAAVALVAREIDPIGTTYGSLRDELRFLRPGNVWRQAIGFRLNAAENNKVALAAGDSSTEVVELPRNWLDRFTSSETTDSGIVVFDDGEALTIRTRTEGSGHHGAHDGDILSPMPGKIIAVDVTEGQSVTKGQKLLTLEAMKMEHTLTAPFDGVVAELKAVSGAQVQVDALLARIEVVEE
jgi:3-methylcrotonyl-CoA carboxylase alpha subunit